MYTVGVTGGIGSGKSTVCRMFTVLGIPVFNSDAEGKHLLQNDPEVRAQLEAAFGKDLFVQGMLDRRSLGKRVFNDPRSLEQLNAIVHPAVRKVFSTWAAKQAAPYVINEAAILVETGAYKQFGRLVVVTAPVEQRIQWVMGRDGATRDEVLARMRNQAEDATKLAVADHTVVNDGRSMLIPQVLAIHEALLHAASR